MVSVRGWTKLLNKIRRGEEAEELRVQGTGGISYVDIEIMKNYVKSSIREHQLCFEEENHIKFLKFIFIVCLRICKTA